MALNIYNEWSENSLIWTFFLFLPFPLALNFSFSLALNGCQKDRAQPTPRPAPLKASALFLLNKINDAWHQVCLKSPHLKNAHLPPYFSSALAPPIFRISTANFRGQTSNFLSPEFWCVSKQNGWTGAGGHHSFKKKHCWNYTRSPCEYLILGIWKFIRSPFGALYF